MMTMKWARTFLSLLAVGLGTAQDAFTCDDTMNRFCETEGNRYCYIAEETGKPTCGNCLPTFVEWRARCVSEDNIDILLFLEEYKPIFLEPLSNAERAEILLKVIAFIASYQNQNPPPPFELGLNAFSADDAAEIKARLGFRVDAPADEQEVPTFKSLPPESSALPEKVDWVEAGAVTSVKDQGRCGCCWAVSATGAIEGATAIQNDFLDSLSFQQYISCDDSNYGCNGGSLVYAMAYVLQGTDGIATNLEYPFTDSKGQTTETCNTDAPVAVTVKEASYVVDFYDDYSFDERLQRMKTAVAKQPVSMVLRSGCPLFSNYKRGILTSDDGCECNDPDCADHAVLMVGYDDTSSPPSWKIKNSWSTGWGEDGYVRISQEQKGDYGLFGVLLHGVVPDLAYNTTEGSVTESDASGTAEEETALPWWAWLLILLAACLIVYVTVSCFIGLLCPRSKKNAQ